MKIVIAPEYAHLERHVQALPLGQYVVEKTYCNRRNVVEKVRWGGEAFVVKRYKRPTLANCVVYTWLRKSKPRRAFEYAQRLLAAGIETAKPVAYIEKRKFGFFHTGWFVSEYLPYPVLPETYRSATEEEREQLASDYVDFMIGMHRKGIFQKDNNPTNTLVHREDGTYKFAMVDINRVRFGKVPTKKQVMKSLVQICPHHQELEKVVPLYARRRGMEFFNS